MKRFAIVLFTIISLFTTQTICAQDSLTFKPSGKIIARGFLDYSTGFGKVNDEKGFDITRAFLGYNYKFTRTLQGQVIIDGAAGKTSSDGLEVYLRNAFLNWNDKGFNINIGMIGLMQFSTQEKFWRHRYVIKSFQDLNKMAPSVDLGITASYDFNSSISADISLTNGEGNKKIKKDNSMRYAIGTSLNPTSNITFRAYADVYNNDKNQHDKLPEGVNINYKDQYTLAIFAGYENKFISGGIEFNKVYNKGFIEKKDYYGYSFYASAKVGSKWRTFARYDITNSSSPSTFTSPWYDLDGQLIIIGAEFQPFKQLKIAPNLRNINLDRSQSKQYFFVNIEFNL